MIFLIRRFFKPYIWYRATSVRTLNKERKEIKLSTNIKKIGKKKMLCMRWNHLWQAPLPWILIK